MFTTLFMIAPLHNIQLCWSGGLEVLETQLRAGSRHGGSDLRADGL